MSVQVVLLAKLVCDGDAGHVFAPIALDGVDVEEDNEAGEKSQEDQEEEADLQTLPEHVRAPKTEDRNTTVSNTKNICTANL